MKLFDKNRSNSPLPIVVVPFHRYPLEPHEEISLFVLRRVLGKNHQIAFITPHSLVLPSSFLQTQEQHLQFDNHFFSNVACYNKMLLSAWFFENFLDYSHLLIYQLDCLVFYDRLLEWCEKEFSYIGAPWFKHFLYDTKDGLWAVGNSGLSLRNISSALAVLRHEVPEGRFSLAAGLQGEYVDPYHQAKPPPVSAKSIPVWEAVKEYPYYDDLFWSFEASKILPTFRIPRPKQALSFAFEIAPQWCYRKNWWRLPFGCHAWQKYDPEFWMRALKKLAIYP